MSPRLSVIVCVYNMAREAPRTIYSASLPYQRDVDAQNFEVIIVDNGSSQPIPMQILNNLPASVRVVKMPSPQPSPVFALNWAAENHARGELLLFAIDGARIFSQHLYARMIAAHDQVENAFVYTLGWHLGPKVQMVSSQEGYTQEVEDKLIAQANWPHEPDALFDISVFAGSSVNGFFVPISESNAFSVSRKLYQAIGGYDERFTSPGAGLANLEIFQRYVTRSNARNVCLLGEGTFHQIHGGVATSGKVERKIFHKEYQTIFSRPYKKPQYQVLYLGPVRQPAMKFLRQSVELAEAKTL